MYGDYKGISGWQKISFIDYPGAVSTVLFFEGCNLRCPYCHNPDIVFRRLPQISWSDIKSFLLKRKDHIDGVVLSGGEPTLHSVLPDVVREIRQTGLLVKIDTNGSNPEMINTCKPDYLALDFKTDPLRYVELGNTDSLFEKKFKMTLDIVKKMNLQAEVRITVASPFIDENVITGMVEVLKGVQKVFLQPVKITENVIDKSKVKILSKENILKLREILTLFVGSCIIRGEE